MSSIIQKLAEAVGLKSPPVEAAPFVTCPSCKHLVPASEPEQLVAARCPSCSCWSPLLDGSSFVFLCASCEGGTRTYFALDEKGRPFSVYGLKRIRLPEKPAPFHGGREVDHQSGWETETFEDESSIKAREKYETEMKKYSRQAIETALQEGRQVLSREEEEKLNSIPRFCINAKCTRYCRETKGGVMECSACKSKIVQLATVHKICSNPACEVSERDPATGFIPIVNGVCRTCGHPHGKRPGTVRPEEVQS